MANPMISAYVKVVDNQAKAYARIDRSIDSAFLYVLGAIRRNARNSIRRGSKSKPHSLPGKPINSRSGIYKNTIERSYSKSLKTGVAGPKTRGFKPNQGQRVVGKTIPQLLEYGGTIRATRPTFIPAEKADMRARNIAYRKQKVRKRDLKWVIIPPGTRQVDARPTMRLAMAKATSATNLKWAFERIARL